MEATGTCGSNSMQCQPMAIAESRIATDTRHRVSYPNSKPRRIKLVGLGQEGCRIARQIGTHGLQFVDIIETNAKAGCGKVSSEEVIRGIASDGDEIQRTLQDADMIFMVASNTDNVAFSAVIGRMGRDKCVPVTGIFLQDKRQDAAPGATSLDLLRKSTDMLIIASDESFLLEMLGELGA